MEITKVIKVFLFSVAVMSAPVITAQETTGSFIKSEYIPEIHGTIRAKYEYEPTIGKGRFEIRNARMSVEGKIIPIVRYKAEIDLSNEEQSGRCVCRFPLMPIVRRISSISPTVPS